MWRNIVLLLAVLFSVYFLIFTQVPLGVPGEWVWLRQALPSDVPEAIDRLSVPLLIAAILIFFCRFADHRFAKMGAIARIACLCLLTFGGIVWLGAARHAAPSPHREVRPLWVLYDKYASGYFFEAAFQTSSQRELLSTYQARMAKGDVLHEGTHPPGLFLLNFLAIELTRQYSTVGQLAQFAVNQETSRLFRTMESEARMARPLSQTEFGALCLVSVISTFLCASTLWPVYGIVKLIADPRTAWRAACLMITIPSLAVFAPRSDVVYAFSATLLLWLILKAVLSPSQGTRVFFAVLTGVATCACLTVSLAHLPALVAAGVYCVLLLRGPHKVSCRQMLLIGTVMLSTFALLVACWGWITGCHLTNVWRMNLSNHAAFYDQSPRTWWKWFLVNPLELCFALGLPLMIVTGLSAATMIMSILRKETPIAEQTANATRLSFALLLTWAALWLSGKNMGEAARLWCFLTPWFVIVASWALPSKEAAVLPESSEPPERSQISTDSNLWLSLLISQLTVCALTAGRVTGYLEL